MKKKTALFCAIMLLVLSFAVLPKIPVHAFSVNTIIGTADKMEIGKIVDIPFQIVADGDMACNCEVRVEGGGELSSITVTPGSVNDNLIVYDGMTGASSISGYIGVSVKKDAEIQITISGSVAEVKDKESLDSLEINQTTSIGSVSNPVKATETETGAEATGKDTDKEDESILEEQESIQAEEAEKEDAKNESVKESAAKKESVLAEENGSDEEDVDSVTEYEFDSEAEEKNKDIIIAQDGSEYYAISVPEKKFYFSTEIKQYMAPQGYDKITIDVDGENIEALTNENLPGKVVLVRGKFMGDKKDQFYFYDQESGLLFMYQSSRLDNPAAFGGLFESKPAIFLILLFVFIFGGLVTFIIQRIVSKKLMENGSVPEKRVPVQRQEVGEIVNEEKDAENEETVQVEVVENLETEQAELDIMQGVECEAVTNEELEEAMKAEKITERQF